MTLPNQFTFHQGNLQDFVHCRRKFFLRHIRNLNWPAVQSEPFLENEKYLQQGTIIHNSIQQFFLGIDREKIEGSLSDETLTIWWHNFLDYIDQTRLFFDPGSKIFTEHTISTVFAEYRLVAKLDLVCITQNKEVLIYDWKTSRTVPKRSRLENRLQTIVYPYVVSAAGKHLSGGQPIDPEKIKLTYWFTSHPSESQVFSYSRDELNRSETYLLDMVSLIERLSETEQEESFPKTDDRKKCAYCVYRSLCNTGIGAGKEMDDFLLDDAVDLDFDFDQITEILIG